MTTTPHFGKWLFAAVLLAQCGVQVEAATPVNVGSVQATNIGHSFFNPNQFLGAEAPPTPCTVADNLIDQDQSSAGGAVLPSVTVNWDTNSQFTLTVSAPAGRKFLVQVPRNRSIALSGWLRWQSVGGGSLSNAAPVIGTMTGIEGTAPQIFGSAGLSDSHAFFGVESLGSTPITGNLAFTSLTLTGNVVPQVTGLGPLPFTLHPSSSLSLVYTTPETNDPGPFVSIVPYIHALDTNACSFSIMPSTRFHGYGANGGTVQVTTGAGCLWRVVNTNSWVSVAPTNGFGSGMAGYQVSANPSPFDRMAYIEIASQAFVLWQRGNVTACVFAIEPASRFHGSGAEAGSIHVSTVTGCAWAVLNTNAWIQITTGGNNSGSGVVEYTVSPNIGTASRSGNITVGNRAIPITQAGVSIPPTAERVTLNAGESFTYTFSALPLFLQNDPPGDKRTYWVAEMQPSGSNVQRRLQLEMFENSTTEIPLAVQSYDVSTQGAQSFTCWTTNAAWQDLQGVVRATVLQGRMQLNDMGIHSWLPAGDTYNHHFALIRAVNKEPKVSIAGLAEDGGIIVTFTGILQTAREASGPYEDVPGNPQGTYTIPKEIVHSQPYFRARRSDE